jgi:hypothetical protein
MEGAEGQALVAFNRIDALGWYHVVIANVNDLYKP